MKLYTGPCAGGPHDGKMITASAPHVIIPLAPRDVLSVRSVPQIKPKYTQGEYLFNEDVQMWIWQGQWKEGGTK